MDVEKLLAGPTGVLIREEKEIKRTLGLYTVPVVYYKGAPSRETFDGSASGVLVRLFGKHFLLTPGHVVKDIREMSEFVHLSFDSRLSAIRMADKGGRDPELDAGYVELNSTDASTIEAKHNLFCSEKKLDLSSPDNVDRNEWMVLGGFAEARSELCDEYFGSALSTFTTQRREASRAPGSSSSSIFR